MKKTLIFLIVTSLLMVGNLFAQTDGNLIVEGSAWIGKANQPGTLDVVGSIKSTKTVRESDTSGGFVSYFTNILEKGNYSLGFGGVRNMMFLRGDSISGNKTWQYVSPSAQENTVFIGRAGVSPPDTYTITDGVSAASYIFEVLGNNSRNYTVDAFYGVYSKLNGTGNVGVGNVAFTNAYLFYGDNYSLPGGYSVTNNYGLYLKKLTKGIYNYGIVLDGDGGGANIAFGSYNQCRPELYSNQGDVYVKDCFGNNSPLGPHDPETGEWIFYSKNTKTGRTMRVNMEELVRDMEKLTGKKYLIESFVDTK